jgi:hypothetical protein
MSRSMLLLLIAAPAALLMACGSDTSSGTTTTGAGGSTSATGTGGSPSTTGTGGSPSTSGTGGSPSTTGTGGDSTSTSSTSATSSTGTGPMMGACTNAADLGIVQTKDVKTITADCGKANIGNDTKTKACIKMGTNLSDPCVTCFADTVSCVINKCLNQCIADSNSQMCTDCRAANCDPAFEACSGLPAK